jgi:hypothetical protein
MRQSAANITGFKMAKIKSAAMMTATVLAMVYVLRQVSVTRGLVDKALNG